jgi:hypothetical protein
LLLPAQQVNEGAVAGAAEGRQRRLRKVGAGASLKTVTREILCK